MDIQYPGMMQAMEDFQLDANTRQRVAAFDEEVRQFNSGGALDPIASKKLQESFRLQHIFHSTGIEGNRLSLHETEAVLFEGLIVGGKPLADQQAVQDLDAAFNYLQELGHSQRAITEVDVREMHRLVVRNRPDAQPGQYRMIGVVISGSEHRPPEPIAVPGLVQKTVEWLNTIALKFPMPGAAYIHHQIAAIHPFVDGNGRLSRLLMNMVLLRSNYPIVNIRREDRPRYYEALAFADVGLYSSLLELTVDRAAEVLSEMKRVRDETERMRVFAARWGATEGAVIQRREEREYKQWVAQMQLVRLAFENVADLLDEKLQEIRVEFWPYPEPDFAKFVELREKGNAAQCWFFRIRLRNRRTDLEENFMFSFYRDYAIFPKRKVIPLSPNRQEGEKTYLRITSPKLRLREIFVDENKGLTVRIYNPEASGSYTISSKISPEQAAQEFFSDVLQECFGLKQL